MKLSAIVITKNEEHNIIRCLNSLSFADEIIVVDAESTDQTASLAEKLGAKVFVRPWPGYGPQKNYGAREATGDWLLFIDADEEVTPALANEISAIIKNPTVDFYWLKIVTVFLHTPLTHLYGHNPRLFKKSAGQWTPATVHEQVERYADHSEATEYQLIQLDDRFSQVLQQPLLHHSHQTVASYLKRMHHYTTLDAEHMVQTGQHRSGRTVTATWWLPLQLASRQFLKLLFYRKGIFDGYAGCMWCFLSSYYEYEMGTKYSEKLKMQSSKV